MGLNSIEESKIKKNALIKGSSTIVESLRLGQSQSVPAPNGGGDGVPQQSRGLPLKRNKNAKIDKISLDAQIQCMRDERDINITEMETTSVVKNFEYPLKWDNSHKGWTFMPRRGIQGPVKREDPHRDISEGPHKACNLSRSPLNGEIDYLPRPLSKVGSDEVPRSAGSLSKAERGFTSQKWSEELIKAEDLQGGTSLQGDSKKRGMLFYSERSSPNFLNRVESAPFCGMPFGRSGTKYLSESTEQINLGPLRGPL